MSLYTSEYKAEKNKFDILEQPFIEDHKLVLFAYTENPLDGEEIWAGQITCAINTNPGIDFFIEELFVVEEYRLQGLAQELVQQAFNYFLEKNVHLQCALAYCYTELLPFYQRLNFRSVFAARPLQEGHPPLHLVLKDFADGANQQG